MGLSGPFIYPPVVKLAVVGGPKKHLAQDVFLKLLAPLQEALRLDGTLMPNEVRPGGWLGRNPCQ